jgi:hypothetical protein
MGKEAPSHGVLGQSDYNLQGNCGETRIHDDYPWSGNFSTKIKCVYVYNYSVKKSEGEPGLPGVKLKLPDTTGRYSMRPDAPWKLLTENQVRLCV